MDPDPSSFFHHLFLDASQSATGLIVLLGILLFLLACSALISGSEVAFFSLSASDLEELESDTAENAKIKDLLKQPEELLGTILIANNFVNVGIVILSTVLLNEYFSPDSWTPLVVFLVEILAITSLLLLFGEILPKVYARSARLSFAKSVVGFLARVHSILRPLSSRLSKTINRLSIDAKSPTLSVDDLEQALELTTDENTSEDEHRILQGIVRFGSTSVKEVMTPRTSVVAIENHIEFREVLASITERGYSRIPVFEENLDQIQGLLYIKDLLPFMDAAEDFKWKDLIREPFFVPESKKIDDLLGEFQKRRVHLAIVVDEFGGTSGIITLEDVLEEIVGEISDEFDDDDLSYSKLDDQNYVFEASIQLIDLCRVLELPKDRFTQVDGESDTLAGLVLELAGKFLEKGEEISYDEFTFKVESVDQRKIIRIKVTIAEKLEEE